MAKSNKKAGKPPIVISEQYGMMTDNFFLKKRQDELNYRFAIKEVGGQIKNAYAKGKVSDANFSLGYKVKVSEFLSESGSSDPDSLSLKLYNDWNSSISEFQGISETPEELQAYIERIVNFGLENAIQAD